MSWILFHLLFSTTMVAAPVLSLLFQYGLHRRHGSWEEHPEARQILVRGIRGLAILTAALGIGFILWIFLDREAIQARQRPLLLTMEILVFHLLWWPIAVPIWVRVAKARGMMQKVDPGNASGPVRMASLKPRRVSDDLSVPVRVAPFVLGLGALAWVGQRAFSLAAEQPIHWLQPVLFSAGGVSFLIGYGFWVHMEVRSPQPLVGDEKTAREYQEALEENRRFRVRFIAILQIAASLAFFAMALLSLEVARGSLSGPVLGIVGGVAGTLVGCLGACFGVAGSMKMQKIQMLRQKLSQPREEVS